MGGKTEKLEKLEIFIARHKAVSTEQILETIDNSERTVRRDLKKIHAITSYTHRGKFVTLPSVASFDSYGIWFYNHIGFTKHRNSMDLIVHIINSSSKGITKDELEKVLKISVSKQIQILMEQGRLYRVKPGAKYCYVPEELAVNASRRIQLLGADIEEHREKKVKLSDLVAVLKAVLVEQKIDMKNLRKLAKKYSLEVPLKKIEQLITQYDLTSKKKR